MPRLTVSMFEGRSAEDKRELAKRLTEVICEVCKCPADAVTIQFEDTKRSNHAKAGVLFSDQ
ncbi:MAG: 4-oxalocrotonate tautomerase [Clostridiales bacterium]|nr:4-oxalocrotonate tautomerase [Clostridiales bacterium]